VCVSMGAVSLVKPTDSDHIRVGRFRLERAVPKVRPRTITISSALPGTCCML
jgi:hypothetical protein